MGLRRTFRECLGTGNIIFFDPGSSGVFLFCTLFLTCIVFTIKIKSLKCNIISSLY